MKKILIFLFIVGFYSCNDKEPLPVESFNVDYSLVSRTDTALNFSFDVVDTDFPSYTISSIVPNISCCQGTFLLENNVDGSINGTSLSSSTVSGNNSFDLTIENFVDGMNYLTIQVDNGFDLYFYSFQFYYDLNTNEVDYLNVIRANESAPDYFTAIFKYDFYTNSNINVLVELEQGIREEPLYRLPNGAGEFRYVTSGGGTDILKSTREKI
ncbi:hypothetical protein [Maribacter sp. 4G9]|uniref:hypothetical protein n=1 Tax=Maribacter sp. 4G9 TaxID=1889777 RepID=UPI000C14C7BF|nr:hypothetical protein [Maribacter sp. 4G9]PIB39072.1 hypothetical protein BFP75_00930 [Maribacter sp. 4G9]